MSEERVVGLRMSQIPPEHARIMAHLPKAIKDWVTEEQKDIEQMTDFQWDNYAMINGSQEVKLTFADGATLQKTFGPFDLIEM